MIFIGDRLGLFKAMKDAGPLKVEQLAARTGLNERYLQERLNSMVAAQSLNTTRAQRPTAHAGIRGGLAERARPTSWVCTSRLCRPRCRSRPRWPRVRTGGGLTEADYPPWMFEATERNPLPRYQFKLARKWIPAMPQVVERLQRGGVAADVGCGGGARRS